MQLSAGKPAEKSRFIIVREAVITGSNHNICIYVGVIFCFIMGFKAVWFYLNYVNSSYRIYDFQEVKMRHKNLCDMIVDDIKKDIISGELKPGDKISGEYDLAKKYEVSRFTVREAMKKLDSTGLITIKHGIGSFVNEITPESFMKPLLPVLVMSNIDIQEICEARLPLEVQSISLCIDRINDEKLSEMKEVYKKMERALSEKDINKYNELDIQFHLLLAKASENRVLFEMLSTLQDMLREQLKRDVKVPDSLERSIKRHKLMIEAIENKEKELAKQLMTLHINDSIDYLV